MCAKTFDGECEGPVCSQSEQKKLAHAKLEKEWNEMYLEFKTIIIIIVYC